MRQLFRFPNPVNELAARTVATGVVLLCLAILAFRQPLLVLPLAFGFVARVLTGPRLSPLGQLATRVIAPRLGAPRLVAGPPKRFAQGIGATLSVAAVVAWFGFGSATVVYLLVAAIAAAAFLEAAFAYCVGCRIFAFLMRAGLISADVCTDCNDISARLGVARS